MWYTKYTVYGSTSRCYNRQRNGIPWYWINTTGSRRCSWWQWWPWRYNVISLVIEMTVAMMVLLLRVMKVNRAAVMMMTMVVVTLWQLIDDDEIWWLWDEIWWLWDAVGRFLVPISTSVLSGEEHAVRQDCKTRWNGGRAIFTKGITMRWYISNRRWYTITGTYLVVFFFCPHPFSCIRPSFSLPPLSSRSCHPGSHINSRLSSPLRTRVRALHFFLAEMVEPFLPPPGRRLASKNW